MVVRRRGMNEIAARKQPLRRRRACAVALALALTSGLAACGDDGGSAATSTGASAAASGAGGSTSGTAGADAPISVIDKVKFLNGELRVGAGTTVVFDNVDSQAHTAISDDNSTFDTGLIAAGAKSSVTLQKPGTYASHCSLHPFMKAQIIVS